MYEEIDVPEKIKVFCKLCEELAKDVKQRIYHISEEQKIDINTVYLTFLHYQKEMKEEMKEEYTLNYEKE